MRDSTDSGPVRVSSKDEGRRYESELEAIMDGVRPDVAEIDSTLEGERAEMVLGEALEQLDMYPESNRNPAAYSQ